jgi:hypothetical protein
MVRNGCLCAAQTNAAGVCSTTNTSCDIHDTQTHCEAEKGCIWAVGCFRAVECLTLPIDECDTHPSCMVVVQGCP